MRCSRENAVILCARFATSRTGHDNILKLNSSEDTAGNCVTLYVCMYLMIGKGQIAQKRPYWGENRLKSKIYG